MDIIERAAAKLSAHPKARVMRDARSICVLPYDESGFHVAIRKEDQGCTVHFEGWHEHFDDELDGLNCFAYGLFGPCRLEITYRGASPVRWALQAETEGKWATESHVGLVGTPFWRKKTVVRKSNHGRGDLAIFS